MFEDPRIEDTLDRWEDLRQQGVEVSAEELCRECPELLPVVSRRIKALRAMEWLEASDPSEPSDADTEPEPVPKTLGRYRLDSLIGAGGFGQVWKGFDPELQRAVAIKIPRSGRLGSPQQVERFLDEARKVAQLQPPGIVPVHDVGIDGDYCFIVSEFIDGGNLADRLASGKLGWQEAVQLIVAIADILHHAHAQGFIHRDIKPANILLDQNGTPYLADFGIATTVDELRKTKTGTAGTLAYMSPEQLRGHPLDAGTDIYGLGVVLYELLVGQRPFVAGDPAESRRIILSETPTFPASVTLPPRLKRICLKALAKEPQDRYSSAREFADALRAVPKERHRVAAWGIGISALATLVLIVLAYTAGWLAWFTEEQAETSPLASEDAATDEAMGIAGKPVPVRIFATGCNHHTVYLNGKLLMKCNRDSAARTATILREGDVIAVRLGDRFDLMELWMMFQTESGRYLFETSENWIAYLPADQKRWWEIRKGQREEAAQFVADNREYNNMVKKAAQDAVPNFPRAEPIYSPLQNFQAIDGGAPPTYVYYVVRRTDLSPKPRPPNRSGDRGAR